MGLTCFTGVARSTSQAEKPPSTTARSAADPAGCGDDVEQIVIAAGQHRQQLVAIYAISA